VELTAFMELNTPLRMCLVDVPVMRLDADICNQVYA
jgi:hypothetical protein